MMILVSALGLRWRLVALIILIGIGTGLIAPGLQIGVNVQSYRAIPRTIGLLPLGSRLGLRGSFDGVFHRALRFPHPSW